MLPPSGGRIFCAIRSFLGASKAGTLAGLQNWLLQQFWASTTGTREMLKCWCHLGVGYLVPNAVFWEPALTVMNVKGVQWEGGGGIRIS